VSLWLLCRPSLKSVYFLEIHPSLCLASRLYEDLERSCTELFELHRAKTPSQRVNLEHRLLKTALHRWHTLAAPGTTYSSQIQRDVCVFFCCSKYTVNCNSIIAMGVYFQVLNMTPIKTRVFQREGQKWPGFCCKIFANILSGPQRKFKFIF